MNSVDPACHAFQTFAGGQDDGQEAPAAYNPEAREQHLMDEETVRANTIKHPCGVTIYDGNPNEKFDCLSSWPWWRELAPVLPNQPRGHGFIHGSWTPS